MQIDIFEDLMYQAGLTAQGCWDELDDYDREAILRFGKLIVNKCAEIALREDHDPSECIKNYFKV